MCIILGRQEQEPAAAAAAAGSDASTQ